jgi:hypothetical protein
MGWFPFSSVSNDKPDRLFTVIKFCIDQDFGASLTLRTDVLATKSRTRKVRFYLLLHLPIEEENEDCWCLWRPDQAGFDSRSVFDGALVDK